MVVEYLISAVAFAGAIEVLSVGILLMCLLDKDKEDPAPPSFVVFVGMIALWALVTVVMLSIVLHRVYPTFYGGV